MLFFSACTRPDKPDDRLTEDGLFRITVQLDWWPEPEHGGLYQARADGLFEAAGLEVVLEPGGPGKIVTQHVAVGEADIGQSASNQVALAIHEGLPLINIASVFHNMPIGLLIHEDGPVDSFEDLDGRRIMARLEAIYLPYLRETFGIDFEVIPQSFEHGQFLSDKGFVQEGFYIAEPYYLRKKGAKVTWLALRDAGYDQYATLFANRRFLARYPERTRAFLEAVVTGWERYLDEDSDAYLRAHAALQAANPENTGPFMAWSRRQIIEDQLVSGRPERNEFIASLDPERFAAEIDLMERLKLIPEGALSVDDIMTRMYLPPRARPAAPAEGSSLSLTAVSP
ncbi:MAG: ABC transporter substrate-binding protein [Opitutales bacterium]